jgi:transposase
MTEPVPPRPTPAPPAAEPDFAAFVAFDWADQKHAVCLQAKGAGGVESFSLDQRPEALNDWANALRVRLGGRPVAVCLEQSRGPLIYALFKYEFITLYPLPPARLAAYRKAFASSGAKDDPSDAALILDYLLRHRDQLRPWVPDDVATRRLALLIEQRRRLVNRRTALSNQLTACLKGYFPQALAVLGESLDSPMGVAFLTKWPDLARLQKAGRAPIRRFFYAHHARRQDLIEQRIAAIAAAVPLTTDAAILDAGSLTAEGLARTMAPLLAAIACFDQQIARAFAAHPDAGVFSSFPGAARVMAPRLLAALGSDRARFASAGEVQTYSGIAPVTRRSGKSCLVHRRWACPKFLRQTFHEFARCSLAKSAWARAYYDLQIGQGAGHHAAIRALAFKWVRVIFACWKRRQPYDEARYLEQLRRKGSPLLAHLRTATTAQAGLATTAQPA